MGHWQEEGQSKEKYIFFLLSEIKEQLVKFFRWLNVFQGLILTKHNNLRINIAIFDVTTTNGTYNVEIKDRLQILLQMLCKFK